MSNPFQVGGRSQEPLAMPDGLSSGGCVGRPLLSGVASHPTQGWPGVPHKLKRAQAVRYRFRRIRRRKRTLDIDD